MLEGSVVNLRIADKKDVPLIAKWWNDQEYSGEYQGFMTISEARLEKLLLETPDPFSSLFFVIEKKDGTKIGHINGWMKGNGLTGIGYAIIPSERGKGYGTEAVKLMVDYLFLSKDIVRIQVSTGTRNIASQKTLEKAGFSKEGTMRKSWFARGEYIDMNLYSILREEWKEPKILTKPLKHEKV